MLKVFMRLFIAFFAFMPLFFTGCTNSVPEITEINATFVFDYKTGTSLPQVRLSVFVMPTSDVGRVSSIDITHVDTGLYWTVTEPLVLSSNREYRAGSPFLMPPYYGSIPVGTYELVYTDMAGRNATSTFNLVYRDDIAATTADFIESKLKNDTVEKMIAIYEKKDGNGTLLYYGEEKDGWTERSKILSAYEKASSVRICLELDQKSAVCLLPPENIK